MTVAFSSREPEDTVPYQQEFLARWFLQAFRASSFYCDKQAPQPRAPAVPAVHSLSPLLAQGSASQLIFKNNKASFETGYRKYADWFFILLNFARRVKEQPDETERTEDRHTQGGQPAASKKINRGAAAIPTVSVFRRRRPKKFHQSEPERCIFTDDCSEIPTGFQLRIWQSSARSVMPSREISPLQKTVGGSANCPDFWPSTFTLDRALRRQSD